MKNVIFYTYTEWAFGAVHYDLAKHLFQYGINCKVLPWQVSYSPTELQLLDDNVYAWISTMDGISTLVNTYGIPIEKCIPVAHAIDDFKFYKDVDSSKVINSGCISQYLKDHAILYNLPVEPKVCPLGIMFDSFYNQPSKDLKIVGYGGTYATKEEYDRSLTNHFDHIRTNHILIKRSYLVGECADKANLRFSAAIFHTKSVVTMPGFYKSVDAIISSSDHREAGGLPVLEAGAAGKLVISTPVGHWHERIGEKGGISVPIPESEFVKKTVEILEFYKSNPSEYRNRCLQIQDHARSYDWEYVIEDWVKLILDD